jgi:hypothetical protein
LIRKRRGWYERQFYNQNARAFPAMAIDDTDPLQQTSNKHKFVMDKKRIIRPARSPRENAIKRNCRWYDLVAIVRQKSSKERKFKYPT